MAMYIFISLTNMNKENKRSKSLTTLGIHLLRGQFWSINLKNQVRPKKIVYLWNPYTNTVHNLTNTTRAHLFLAECHLVIIKQNKFINVLKEFWTKWSLFSEVNYPKRYVVERNYETVDINNTRLDFISYTLRWCWWKTINTMPISSRNNLEIALEIFPIWYKDQNDYELVLNNLIYYHNTGLLFISHRLYVTFQYYWSLYANCLLFHILLCDMKVKIEMNLFGTTRSTIIVWYYDLYPIGYIGVEGKQKLLSKLCAE